jgi:uncharacterized protein
MKPLSTYAFFWDAEKALLNERKHGVSFEEAATVFDDSLAVYFPNLTDDSGEERWIVIGLTNRRTLVVVVHLCSDGNGGAIVRIISARKATSHERREHETSPIQYESRAP